jgi:AraC family transcriptional regulator, dual regulator of chb operon
MHKVRFKNLPVRFPRSHLHVTRLKDRQKTTPHNHDFHEVFLVLEGNGCHHLGREKINLKRGDLVALRPEDTHCFSTGDTQSLTFVNLAICQSWWNAFHDLLGIEPWLERPLSVALTAAETTRLGDELIAFGDGASPLALSQTLEKIHVHLTLQPADSAGNPPPWLDQLHRELAAKPESLGEPIDFWQKRSGRSPEHLARSCRRYYGITFSELINQARVARALHLLRTTDAKVITIAFECGFGNLANFHRVFARQTGRTPSRWRSESYAAVPINSLSRF